MDNKTALRLKPLIIKKSNIRILNHKFTNDRSFTPEDLYKEDILYDTTDMYFLKGEYQRLLLVNRFNILSKQSRAVAKYFSKDGSVVEKTSDSVTGVIGQDQYKTIFTALCSILDQELKIRSILALLTLKSTDKAKVEPADSKKDTEPSLKKMLKENSSQTDEMRIEKPKPRRRIRKPVSPYIIQDGSAIVEKKSPKKDQCTDAATIETEKKPKRLIINISNKLNPETLAKAILRGEKPLVPHDGQQEETGHDFDQISTIQKNSQNSLTDIGSAEQNPRSNLTSSENQELPPKTNDITDSSDQNHSLTSLNPQEHNSSGSMTDLGFLQDEYSNDSTGKLSVLSETPTNPDLLTNPGSLLENIDQHTKTFVIQSGFRVPGTDIVVPFKPEDMFHIATKSNLQYLDSSTKKRLLQRQLTIDYENCLTVMDEDGNLPIHLAVMNNDSELLIRQCIVLKMRASSVDIPVNGPTPLKLAVETGRGELAACLLRHGACPLRTDAAHRACAHDAAEKDVSVLRAVFDVCRQNARSTCSVLGHTGPQTTKRFGSSFLLRTAQKWNSLPSSLFTENYNLGIKPRRKILYENEDLWKPEMETQTDEQLGQYLLKHMCSMYNKQGYNPLMLACMLGLHENVRFLIEHSASVDDRMPTCGNTALYLAVSAACNNAIELGNRSKIVDHFWKTIELLLQHGADPSIDNNYSTNVHTLLQEFNNQELSVLVANKMNVRLFNKTDAMAKLNKEKDLGKVMLVLGRGGEIQCETFENERRKKKAKKAATNPLAIVEDIVLKPGNTSAKGTKKENKVKVFQVRDIPKTACAKRNGVKRKQEAAPIAMKQAKVDK